MSPGISRFHALDVLRGLAALGVVLWHWQHFFFVDGRALPSFDVASQPLYPALFLFYDAGWLGVDLFFCLSGFVFFGLYAGPVSQGLSAAEFGVRRFARLYPLHLLTLLVVAGLQALHAEHTGQSFVYRSNDAAHALQHVLLVQAWGMPQVFSFNAPTWSISVEVLLYAAFYILCRHVSRSALLFALVVTIGFDSVSNPEISRGVTGFFSGCIAFSVFTWVQQLPRQALVEAVLRVAAMLAWALTLIGVRMGLTADFFLPSGPRWVVEHVATVLLFPLTLVCLAIMQSRRSAFGRRLAWLGDASYAIYLWHFPLQIIFALALPRERFMAPLTLLAFMTALIGISVISARLFERPVQDALLTRWRAWTARTPYALPTAR